MKGEGVPALRSPSYSRGGLPGMWDCGGASPCPPERGPWRRSCADTPPPLGMVPSLQVPPLGQWVLARPRDGRMERPVSARGVAAVCGGQAGRLHVGVGAGCAAGYGASGRTPARCRLSSHGCFGPGGGGSGIRQHCRHHRHRRRDSQGAAGDGPGLRGWGRLGLAPGDSGRPVMGIYVPLRATRRIQTPSSCAGGCVLLA